MNFLLKLVALAAMLAVSAAAILVARREILSTEQGREFVAGATSDALNLARPTAGPVPPAISPPPHKPSSVAERGAMDEIRAYLRSAGVHYPVSVVDRIFFFTPMTLDARSVLNLVQIDFTSDSLRKVSAKVVGEFLLHAVTITQQFNCTNHRELLDKNVAIVNVLSTREPDANDQPLPAITLNGKQIQASEGFITSKSTCDSIDPREELRIKGYASAEDRLETFFEKQRPSSSGTGWPLTNGLIVTNHHVANGKRRLYVVRHDREFREGRVLVSDPIRDIAILQVDDPEFLPPAFEIDPSPRDIGQHVFTVGFPWTSRVNNRLPQAQLSQGILSSLPDKGILYQLSMPIHGGNSGGPLLSMDGKVVGIISQKLVRSPTPGDTPENVGLAIRAEHLNHILKVLTEAQVVPPIQFPKGANDVSQLAPIVRDSVLLIVVL